MNSALVHIGGGESATGRRSLGGRSGFANQGLDSTLRKAPLSPEFARSILEPWTMRHRVGGRCAEQPRHSCY